MGNRGVVNYGLGADVLRWSRSIPSRLPRVRLRLACILPLVDPHCTTTAKNAHTRYQSSPCPLDTPFL